MCKICCYYKLHLATQLYCVDMESTNQIAETISNKKLKVCNKNQGSCFPLYTPSGHICARHINNNPFP